MIRFAFVTTFYPPHHFGGDAVLVRHMAEAVARAGHSVEVIYDVDAWRALASRDAARAATLDTAPSNGVEVRALHSRLGPLSPLLTHQLGRPVVHRREIERLLDGADVVHYQNVSLVGGPGILRLGRGAPPPLKLYTAHEHWLVCPTHVLWRHDREPCTGRECLRCLAHYRRPPQLWRFTGLLERSARQIDAFCSPSRFSIEQHRAFGFTRPMTLLPPFLPDAAIESREAADAGPPIFLFVGRLERIKGLDDVIPLFTGPPGGGAGGSRGDRAAMHSPQLWIAGDGTHERALRRLAGDAPRVRFLGRMEPEGVRRLMRQARALVLPSAGFEVFPLVLLEASREGTAIIARRIGPLPELIEVSGGGLLFSTPTELAGAIERLADDPDLARRLGANARRAFEEHWSERAFLSGYLALIERLARERGLDALAGACGSPLAFGGAARDPASTPTPPTLHREVPA